MAWRTRVHAHYLQLGNWAVDRLTAAGQLLTACDVALAVLGVDPTALEIERKLIGLYWRLGHRSAAETQFAHLGARRTGRRARCLPLQRPRSRRGALTRGEP